MARDIVPVTESSTRYPVLPVVVNSLDFVFTGGDSVNGLEYTATGREVVVMRNTNVGAQTFTIKSVKDELNRTGDLGPYTMQAGEFAFHPVPLKGFQQADGKVWIDVSHDEVHCAVLRMPSMP